jgi:hypothetical protein
MLSAHSGGMSHFFLVFFATSFIFPLKSNSDGGDR